MIGVHLQLFNGTTPQASLSGLKALWWNHTSVSDFTSPAGRNSDVSTDSSGYVDLDLSAVSALSVGGKGFLMLYQPNIINSNDALVFSGVVAVSDITSGAQMAQGYTKWTRPSDWLTMPTVGSSDQKFVGLLAVYDHGSNHVAISAAENYTVDWGDGSSTENIASGVTASHVYTYSGISDSTLCTRGYKQVLVTVVPQSGKNLTTLNLQVKHANSPSNTNIPWLDIALGSPSLTTLRIGTSNGAGSRNIRVNDIECVQIVSHAVTSMSYMFHNCSSLQSVPLFNTAAVTSMTSMFNSCYSLQSVPLFNTAAVTSMAYMFNTCYSLQSVPLFNTAAVTSMSYMFSGCSTLQSVPAFNTAAVTSMSYMFNGCYSLQSVPLFNTAAVKNMSYMFAHCYSLQSVPLFNTAAVTSMSSMFYNCYSLEMISCSSASSITDFTSTFTGCISLSRIKTTGCPITFSLANCNLGPTELDEIYTGLPTVTGKTITVTGNWGTGSHTPSIATAKGWTVTV